MQPNYAVVILSYNHPALTSLTVQSVIEIGFPESQIFLVHNGSQINFVDELKNNFKNVNHLVQYKNKGYTGGCNFGLSEVFKIFPHAFLLTNDTEAIALPTAFPEDHSFVSGLILKRKTEQIDSVAGALNVRTGQLKHIKSFYELKNLKKYERLYIPGTAFGITEKCFSALAGFDESFHTYWEDVDLSLRAHQLGFKVGFLEDFKLRHKIGKTCHKDRFYTLYLFQRNRRKLMKKHGLHNLQFMAYYSYDMLKLLWRIMKNEKRREPLKLWWRALHEPSF